MWATRPSFPLLAQDVHRVGVVVSRNRCYSELVASEAQVGCSDCLAKRIAVFLASKRNISFAPRHDWVALESGSTGRNVSGAAC